MKKIEEMELSIVDKDISNCFTELRDGRYELGLPTKMQIARKLNELCGMLTLFIEERNNAKSSSNDCSGSKNEI